MSFYTDQTSFYVVVDGVTANYDKDSIVGFKGKRLTQSKPSHLSKNEIAIKLTVSIPKEAFDAFQPEAVIDIPADLAAGPSIAVVADDATEDES